MSLAGSIRAGAAYVEVFADKNPLTRGLTAARAEMSTWAGSLKNVGGSAFGGALEKLGEFAPLQGAMKFIASPAGMFTGMLGLSKMAGESGSAIKDLSLETGVAIKSLGSLRYAATQTGLGDEGLAGLMFRLQGEIGQAAAGAEEAAQKFAKFGMSAQQLAAMAPDEQLRAIAARLAQVTDQTQRANMARELLGKGGGKALPFLLELTELEARAKELGFDNINAETAKVNQGFDRLLTDVKLMARGIGNAIGSAVIPVLKSYVEAIIKGAVVVRDWVKEHRGLIQSAFKISALFVGVGGAFLVAGFALSKIAAVAGMAASGISLIGTAVGAVMKGLSLLMSVPSLLASGFAALTSPVGLFVLGLVAIGAAIGAGLAAWMLWTDSGQATLSQLRGAWDTFKGDMLETWGGIVDAIGAGEIGLAWDIAVSGMSLQWTRFVGFFKDSWSSIKMTLSSVFVDAWASVRSGFASMVSWMRSTWSSFTTWAGGLMLDFGKWQTDLAIDAAEAVGAISKQTADAARQRTEKVRNDTKSAWQQEDADKQAQLEREYQADLKRIKSENWADRNDIGRTWNEERRQREADLAAKKKALDDLREKARQAKEDAKPKPGEEDGSGQTGGFAGGLPGPTTTYGSFSGAAGALMGGGGPLANLVEIGRDHLQVAKRNEAFMQKIANDGGMI